MGQTICEQYTECQEKLQTFAFYVFTYFQNNLVRVFGTTMFGRHWLNFCKDYFVIYTFGKHVFYKLSRFWDVIENHEVSNLHVLLFLMILCTHSSKVVECGCDQLSKGKNYYIDRMCREWCQQLLNFHLHV